MERYLIINADDFGSSLAANAAIEHLFNDGFITSTTLMTPCPWAEDALHRAKQNPKMRVGLHLTLNAEWPLYKWGPVCKTKLVPSLLAADGYFYHDVASLLKKAKAEDVVSEIEAQLEFCLKRNYRPTHVDNHMGSLYGLEGHSFLPETFAFCAKHGFNFRLPRSTETFGPVPNELTESFGGIIAAAEAMGIGLLDNLCSHPFALTKNDSYETVKAYYLNLIRNARAGLTEMYLHPAKESDELKGMAHDWQKRVWEYQLMLDEGVMKTIESEGVKLVGWTDAPFKI